MTRSEREKWETTLTSSKNGKLFLLDLTYFLFIIDIHGIMY